MNCWKPVQLYCVHTVQLNCLPTLNASEPVKDTYSNAVEEALKLSVPSIPLAFTRGAVLLVADTLRMRMSAKLRKHLKMD
jgi:hypothetical protein